MYKGVVGGFDFDNPFRVVAFDVKRMIGRQEKQMAGKLRKNAGLLNNYLF